ncbi:hypothetical protein A2954_00105 [Candidatus Roizmanbacteria bacterium RIFCSPLOWO2_01_FULL_37_12]|uniref:NADP-dependent oxidoreductase domain-containing protein n=1 Tax=Candidatus Roizmanbacteria bacterium RIFCSPLOWO2_01_FULL_37_12 TaxID=1802056 RepID=A0A1F7IBE9_9BACT|nr:MAG: hypothetical protein A2954_00105 [Candidatus Roizmanbacteria bacterium RIFCSPLOWO2_01_FULL_37_12]
MKIPTKKLKNGLEIPVLGFGTWTIGGKMESDPSNDEQNTIGINNALKIGITHFDTAEKYAAGHAEELLGLAIKNIDRSKLFITTKVANTNLGYDDVIASCKKSLNRLKTDYIDLYLIHAPNDGIPIKETMKAMGDLIKQGLVRNIGVSNFTTSRLKEAQKNSDYPIVTNQVFYNLFVRQPETDGLIQYCQQNDILITAFRPVERGILTRKGIPILDEISKKYKKTSAQIALNWLVSQPNVIAISKMSNKKHLEENLGALGWEMKMEDVDKLKREFPDQQKETSETPLR